MDINGIWINVVNLVSNYMYHKPPLGDGWDGVSWWNHPIFLVKSPKLGPEQRWRHKCSRGHWGGAEAAACNDPEMEDFLDSRNVFDVSKRVKKYLV